MNHVNLIGNLGQDPEIKYQEYKDPNGEAKAFCKCSFSLAVPEYNKKEKKNVPIWIKCKATGKTAENIGEFFKKGNKIAIEGKLKVDTWKNEAGEPRSITYIEVLSFDFLTKKETSDDSQRYGTEELSNCDNEPSYSDLGINEDEIPF